MPVCRICSDRTCPGKHLKSKIHEIFSGPFTANGLQPCASTTGSVTKGSVYQCQAAWDCSEFVQFLFQVLSKAKSESSKAGFGWLKPAKACFIFLAQRKPGICHVWHTQKWVIFFSAADKLMWEKIHSIDFPFPVAFERLLMQQVHKSTHMSVCTVIANKLTFLKTIFSL